MAVCKKKDVSKGNEFCSIHKPEFWDVFLQGSTIYDYHILDHE